jgi:hypothetical protein
MFLNCETNENISLFAVIFYHEFSHHVQDIIDWLTNPYTTASLDNAIADSISAVVDTIPMVGLISQVADNAAGACFALCNKTKNAALFEHFGTHLYSDELRLAFLKQVFKNEKTVSSIGFAMLATTNPTSCKEMMMGNHFLPDKHRWMRMISQKIMDSFIKNIQQSDMIIIDHDKLSKVFRQAVYNTSMLFMDDKYQVKHMLGISSLQLKQRFNNIQDGTKLYINKITTKIQTSWRKYSQVKYVRKLRRSIHIITKVFLKFWFLIKHPKKKQLRGNFSIRNKLRGNRRIHTQMRGNRKQNRYQQNTQSAVCIIS